MGKSVMSPVFVVFFASRNIHAYLMHTMLESIFGPRNFWPRGLQSKPLHDTSLSHGMQEIWVAEQSFLMNETLPVLLIQSFFACVLRLVMKHHGTKLGCLPSPSQRVSGQKTPTRQRERQTRWLQMCAPHYTSLDPGRFFSQSVFSIGALTLVTVSEYDTAVWYVGKIALRISNFKQSLCLVSFTFWGLEQKHV